MKGRSDFMERFTKKDWTGLSEMKVSGFSSATNISDRR